MYPKITLGQLEHYLSQLKNIQDFQTKTSNLQRPEKLGDLEN